MQCGELYLGLMSGTSADSIDAALFDFSSVNPTLIARHSADIADLQAEIFALACPGNNEIHRLNQLDRELGLRFAEAALTVLEKSGVPANLIRAIGSHGQTIRHFPPQASGEAHAYTHQIGDPNTIAQLTGITTVADFRRRDIAVGGQGAPLVPAFHQAVFSDPNAVRAIINIGGMANVSLLTGQSGLLGFDTGPGNVLMDGWVQRHQQLAFDRDGDWAASGSVDDVLLDLMLQHPYLQQAAPKSTGREVFNLAWLDDLLSGSANSPAAENVQATLLEFTARSICDSLNKLPDRPNELYLCGGGAKNRTLMARIAQLASPATTTSTAALGIDPQWVETAAFAWLAKQTLLGLPGNAPSATGAECPVVLGGVYPA